MMREVIKIVIGKEAMIEAIGMLEKEAMREATERDIDLNSGRKEECGRSAKTAITAKNQVIIQIYILRTHR